MVAPACAAASSRSRCRPFSLTCAHGGREGARGWGKGTCYQLLGTWPVGWGDACTRALLPLLLLLLLLVPCAAACALCRAHHVLLRLRQWGHARGVRGQRHLVRAQHQLLLPVRRHVEEHEACRGRREARMMMLHMNRPHVQSYTLSSRYAQGTQGHARTHAPDALLSSNSFVMR